MVGLSDIPCVGIVVNRISEVIVDIAFRGSRYLFCTKNLVKDLNSEIKKVGILENEFARKVDEATNDGKIIEGHVVEWQENVENIKIQAAEISAKETSCTCFRVQFPNPIARFRLSRRAAHLTKTVTEQTNSGKDFLATEIAHRLPIEYVPDSDTPYQSFESRQEAYVKLWDSIVKEDGCPILGIYGMPGVGKTRTMEQVSKEAMEKGIFQKVTRANVGDGNIDIIKLQDQLAGYLDCHLTSKDNKEVRASQLQNSLKNRGKTLVILDDVWDVIPLNKIGIPFADGSSKGCKILLTSRRKDLCLGNNCEDPIEIRTLTVTEAWEMFKNTVGRSKIESLKDASLAEKVCKECGGLPLLIHAVGKALKYATENTWKDALYQLQNRKFEEIDGIDPQVYACIRLSFLKLTESTRICLLLCALFPEDADIEINMLFDIATASELLEPGRNISGLVDILKSSSLLLQGKDDYTVKLHDIIRDVARSVAVADSKYAFLFVRCKARWPDNADYCTRRLLHVDLEGDNVRFPSDDLVCQHLCILWLQGNNHIQNRLSSFVKRFTNLRVVVLQSTRVTEEQFSVRTFDKRTMLSLDDCRIDQVFLNSVSKTLETLCISKCGLPVPLGIPEFKDLIKLELVNIYPPPVVTGISKQTKLGELNVPSGFADSTGISSELSTCNCLRKLAIKFRDQSGLCPSNILDNLDEFRIDVGLGYGDFIRKTSHRRAIRIAYTNMESGWMALLERAEDVELDGVKGLRNGLSDSCNSMSREAFANLRVLDINNCNEMQHIARWDGRNQQQLKCFTNLRNLDLFRCGGLEYLFSSRVANCLQQLQTLKLNRCKEIEEIVRVDDGQEIISFPNLTALYLWRLRKLTSVYNNKIEFPQLKNLQVLNCDKLEIVIGCTELHGFSNLEEVEVHNCNSLKTVFQHSSPANPNAVFPALRRLILETLPHLESFLSYGNEFLEIDDSKSYTLLSSSIFRSFQQLQVLKVSGSNLLKEIVEDAHGFNQKSPLSLPKLKDVRLSNLPNLQNSGISACYLPELWFVEVDKCAISSLFTCSAFRNLHELGILRVKNCHLLEQISVDDTNDETPGPSENMISLPRLRDIKLEHLHGLKSFSSNNNNKIEFPQLNELELRDCYKLEIVIGCTELHWFKNLEQVKVRNCNSLKTVFQHSSPANQNAIFPALRRLTLGTLPHLESFLSYGNEFLETDDSKSYTLLSSSVFRSFQQLQVLKVSGCNLLKEIVEDAHGFNQKSPLSLPKLKEVMLYNLPNLQNSGISACYLPELWFVEVDKCAISSLFTCSAFRNLHELGILRVKNCHLLEQISVDDTNDETPRPSENMISLPCLKTIEHLHELKSFSSNNNNKIEFPRLKKLVVLYCHKLEIVIECTELHGFSNLEEVVVRNCNSLKTLFLHSSPANQNAVFPALSQLTLETLPHLESFLSYGNEFLKIDDSISYTLLSSSVFRSFQQLQVLQVSGCNLLKEIVEDAHGVNQKSPISLPKLTKVKLSNLPNLQNSGVSACYMPELWFVEVDKCAISSLFTCSAFRNLHKLQILKVRNCHLLEQIFVDDTNDETPGPSENMISLPRLRIIELKHLHGLKSFSSSSTFTFTMPALKNITLTDCPCMDKFTFLQTTTPLLEEDLNDFVRRSVQKILTYTEHSSIGDGDTNDGKQIQV